MMKLALFASLAIFQTTLPPSIARTTVAQDDLVRSQCRTIFETAFPPHKWTSKEDLESFSKLMSNSKDNYFACPVGVRERQMTNFDPSKDFMDWVEKNELTPTDDFRYYSKIGTPIMVTEKVCTFQHNFAALVGGSCHVESTGNVVMELDEQGKMVHWADHWDFNAFYLEVEKCLAQFESLGDTPARD